MTVYRDKEDGSLTTGFSGMDFDNYDILSPKEVIDIIDAADFWDDIEPDIYRTVCEELGLDYDSYDDPDTLFDDMKASCE